MAKTKHFSMIRSFHVADRFTLANTDCGIGALFAMMSYKRGPAFAKLYLACALIRALSSTLMISRTLHIPKR